MVGSESFCRSLWRCDNGRGESVGFENRCWERSVDAVVVEIGALDRCGDIARRRPGASRLLEGTGPEHYEAETTPSAVKLEPVSVLEYLAARVSHLRSGERSAE